MAFLMSGLNENQITEFYFVGLESYEDFDSVIDELQKMAIRVLSKIDGIYSRTSELSLDEKKFKVIYHEDVGIYSFLLEDQSDKSNKWLAQILEDVTERINNYR